jgi:hypothetical protein
MRSSGLGAQWFADLTRDVSQASPLEVGAGITICAAVGAIAAWLAWRNLHKARTIEDIPTSKTRSAPQGYVELEGVARLFEGVPLVAPLSGLPCVWYRYQVEEQVRTQDQGKQRFRWNVIDKGESTETFWLEDDTGRVVVDPEGADISPKHKDDWESFSRAAGITRQPDFIVQFLSAHSNDSRYRFTEWRINPGDAVYALGLLKNLGSLVNGPSLDEAVRTLLHEWKKDQPTLVQRFDLNQDKHIDEKEWMLARAQARREVLKSRQEQQRQFNDGINLLGPTKDASRPYILSAYPQGQITQRYRWQAAAFGAGFFLAGITAVWLFNTRFGG